LDRNLDINPKSKNLERSHDGGKKDSQLGQDLNEDPHELVDERKKKKISEKKK